MSIENRGNMRGPVEGQRDKKLKTLQPIDLFIMSESTQEAPAKQTNGKEFPQNSSDAYIARRLTPNKDIKKVNGNGNGHKEIQDISTPFKPQVATEKSNGNGVNGHEKAKVEHPDYLKGHDAILFSDLVKSGQMAEYYPFFEDEMDAKISKESNTKIEFQKAAIEIGSGQEGSGVLRLKIKDNKEELFPLKSNVAVRESEDKDGQMAMKFIFPQIDDSGKGEKKAVEVSVTKNGWEKRTLSRDKNQTEEDIESLNAADKVAEQWAIKFNASRNKDDSEDPNIFVSNRFAPVVPRDFKENNG